MEDYKQQLKLLSIFHYVLGGLTALFSCFPFIHIAIGIAIVVGALDGDGSDAPPRILGWFFIILPAIFILCGWALSACMIIAGKKLSRCKSRIFCIVIAGIECAMMPFGTVLGIFTIITLTKDPVKELFE